MVRGIWATLFEWTDVDELLDLILLDLSVALMARSWFGWQCTARLRFGRAHSSIGTLVVQHSVETRMHITVAVHG